MSDTTLKQKLFNIVKYALGWPISLIAILFLAKSFSSQISQIQDSLTHLNLSLFIPGIFCFVIYYYLRSLIWYKLLDYGKHVIDVRESLYLWSFTQLRRYIPGNIWAVLGVATVFNKKNIPKKELGTYILWESEIVIIAAAILSLFALPFLSTYYLHLESTIFPITLVLITLIIVGIVIYCLNNKIISRFKGKIETILCHTFPSFSPLAIFKLIILMTLSFIFLGLGYYFITTSITYVDPNLLTQFLGFFTFSLIAGFVSVITPSGLGVREGVLTIMLGNIVASPIAAFISIFARIVLILTEIVCIGLFYLMHKVRTGVFDRLIRFIIRKPHETVVVGIYIIFSWYFTALSFLRYDNYFTGRFDLGNMSQTVWNTTQGRIFEFTNPNSTDVLSRMAFHADVILIAFAPFYAIFQSPKVLLLLQVLILGAGVFFVYFLSMHFTKNKMLSLIFSFLFLLNPSVQRSVIYDFHAVTLATTLLLGSSYFLLKKRYGWFVVFSILAGLCKEQIWAIIALMGLYISLIQKQYKLGIAVFTGSTFIAYLLIWHIIPYAAGGGEHFALEYYSKEDLSPSDLIKNTLFHPIDTIKTLLEKDRIMYLRKILEPVGYTSFLAPVFLIFAMPDLFINLLSGKGELYQIYYQYTASITPFIFLSSIAGVAYLRKKFNISLFLISLYLIATGLLSAYLYGPLPSSKEPNTDVFNRPYMQKTQTNALLSEIPTQYSVSTTNSFGSHLSHRRLLYNVPFGMDSADYVVLDKQETHLPSSTEYIDALLKLKNNKQYQVYYEDDYIVAYRKLGIMN